MSICFFCGGSDIKQTPMKVVVVGNLNLDAQCSEILLVTSYVHVNIRLSVLFSTG